MRFGRLTMLMMMPTITLTTVTSSDEDLYAATSAEMPVATAPSQRRVLDAVAVIVNDATSRMTNERTLGSAISRCCNIVSFLFTFIIVK